MSCFWLLITNFGVVVDVQNVNDHAEVSDELLLVAAQHQKKIEESRKSFPEVSADELN